MKANPDIKILPEIFKNYPEPNNGMHIKRGS
jgi:hypothetical protein